MENKIFTKLFYLTRFWSSGSVIQEVLNKTEELIFNSEYI